MFLSFIFLSVDSATLNSGLDDGSQRLQGPVAILNRRIDRSDRSRIKNSITSDNCFRNLMWLARTNNGGRQLRTTQYPCDAEFR